MKPANIPARYTFNVMAHIPQERGGEGRWDVQY